MKPKHDQMDFSHEQQELIIKALREFMTDELDTELGRFEITDLFEFISENLGVLYYNKGVLDAQAVLSNRIDTVMEAISELEKTSPLDR